MFKQKYVLIKKVQNYLKIISFRHLRLQKKENPRVNFCPSNKPPGKVLTLLSIYTAKMRQCLEINKSSGTNKLVNGPRKSRDISTEYEHKYHSGEVKR